MDKLNACGGTRSRRKMLLLGTALASSLIALPMMTTTPAAAQVTCPGGNAPIAINVNDAIVCINANDRTNNAGNAIDLETTGDGSYITVNNSGDLVAINNAGSAYGLRTQTNDDNSPITIVNSGAISVNGADFATGIYAYTDGDNSPVDVTNGGDISVTAGGNGFGIVAEADKYDSSVMVENSGNIAVSAGQTGMGISVFTDKYGSPVVVTNSGDIAVSAGGDGYGISGRTDGGGSDVTITNSGDIAVTSAGIYGFGIYGRANGVGSDVSIANSGDIGVSGDAFGTGISGLSGNGSVNIVNSGSVMPDDRGIYAFSSTATTITNLAGGAISAGSGLAINVKGAAATINNAGLITGFVDLTDNADLFVNQAGGVFQAFGVSDFGMGIDLFTNEVGGVVDTASNPGADESVQFVALETFQNFGTISLVDGTPGDLFTISNTPGGTDLNYIAGSFLAVDAFLGAPGSASDIFRIDGNVSGATDVIVNNTNPLPGTFNPDGITVVQVRGEVDPNAFRLANGPIDTGFFNFDLFFEPRDGGEFDEFELRSFPGGGAFLLPQLITASQDIWHETSDTWFDRSADLRTQLWRNGGSAPAVAGAMYLHGGSVKDGAVAAPGGLSPAVWAKVTHGELEQEDSARTSAFGRDFSFNLDRELYIIDVQSGVDVALKGVMNPSDVLLLSVFGGGVSANLTYDNLGGRRFDYEGGQVGVAATYLSGGLFVDALFNAQFLKIEPEAAGFSQDLDADSYGFRIDTGYRFERGRLFFEPLLTLAYVDSDIDGFSFAGNTVSFQAEDSLRGRVGLRAGTTLWIDAVRFEPFVIASLWGELSDDDNRATLVSNGTRFGPFTDEREDSWGEISLGTNTFLAGSNAFSAFSKIDLIFGEDTEGYIASGGFRVQW